MKRLFAAIKIEADENFLKLYWNLRNSLKHEKIKWVEEENLHLTLKFFGEIYDEKIDPICELIDNSVIDCDSFELQLENVGIFGSSYNPKVIWYGIKLSSELKFLHQTITENLKTIGYYPDRQNFVPHLTIARIKWIDDIDKLKYLLQKYRGETIQKTKIGAVIYYESKLTANGPIYNPVKKFPLKKAR